MYISKFILARQDTTDDNVGYKQAVWLLNSDNGGIYR